MRNVRCAAVQMRCSRNVAENIEKAEALVRQAAAEGAQVILLPELFERRISARSADMIITSLQRL